MPDLRLALPAAALWIACALAIGAPDAAAFAALAGGVLAAVLIASAARRARRRAGAVLVGVVLAGGALGCAVSAVHAPGRTADLLERAAQERQEVTVQVRAESPGRRVASGFDGAERWSWKGTALGVDGADAGPDVRGISVPVTVFTVADGSGAVPPFGSVVAVSGALRANEPGESTSFRLSASHPASVVADAPVWLGWTEPVRSAFARAARETPGDGGALLPGLAIGDESGVSEELDAAMKASALSHLTAVSGANCALVTGLVFVVAARVGASRRMRVVIAATALLAFVVLVGPGASILRAAVMAAVVLLALARGRPADGLPSLALAVVLLLVHDPWMARDYGFALSVAATAGLLLLAGPLARRLTRWMPRAVALAIAVPAAAQLACQPILLLLTPTIPLYGVGANLLAEPAAPVATVLGCLACLTLPWAPWLGELFVRLAWLPSAWIARIAHTAASLPGAALPWVDGIVGVVLCVCVLVAVGVVIARVHLPRPVVVTAALGLGGVVVAYGGVLGGGLVARAIGTPDDWQIAACDVGQGDALLVRDGDAVAMIDVGRTPEAASACLDRLGVARIDLLVLTHYDADHVAGLPGVIERVERALVGPPSRESDEQVVASLEAHGASVERALAGMAGTLGRLRWDVLWPRGARDEVPTGNDGSVVLRTSGAGLTGLFLGDLGERAQDELLGAAGIGRVDVVKVAHHGSADQSERLYAVSSPRIGLLSVGADNGYGHPTRRSLDILGEVGAVAVRTDTRGLILVSPGADGPRVWTERPEAADAGGRPYPGRERGGTWPPGTPAGAARAAPVPARPARSRVRSRSSPGTRSGLPPLCWCRGPRASSPTAPSAPCGTRSRRRIRVSRSATSPPPTTPRASSSPSRAPPSSESRG
ncbi:competence protein ComEC [Leifsonia naganoensis]|uniref:Competence protein ComEC n=1 Tax=Leifsonia naganoensis TaxID=150025 RepID=A0A853DW79_9MICO|nr:competence protein ComEC [Leifsonia naganoensis]